MIELCWQGPFSWFTDLDESVFACPCAESPGIYVWTADVDEGRLAYYVGQTTRAFGQRMYEHFTEYTRGAYSIRDADLLSRGRVEKLYNGFLWPKEPWRRAGGFVDKAAELLPLALAEMRVIRIWFAELEASQRIQRRVEGAIVKALYEANLPYDLPEPGYRLDLRQANEDPIRVRFTPENFLLGLPAELEA
jgi:hypothetical protein